MSIDATAAKARAEERFKKQQEMDDARQAGRQAAEDERAAVEAKTTRLRALRLAKEEADRAVEAATPVKAKRRKAAAPVA